MCAVLQTQRIRNHNFAQANLAIFQLHKIPLRLRKLSLKGFSPKGTQSFLIRDDSDVL